MTKSQSAGQGSSPEESEPLPAVSSKHASNMLRLEASRQKDQDKPEFVRLYTLEYGEQTYTIRADAMDDIEILEFIEDEKYILALRRMLGKEAWTQFKNSVRTPDGRVPSAPLEAFMEKVMKTLDPQDASGS